jgi:predicted Zn-dependent peptidase
VNQLRKPHIFNLHLLYPQVRGFSTKIDSSALSNGIRVATSASSGELASFGIYVDAGSRNENEHNNGITNLAQRLAFDAASVSDVVGIFLTQHGGPKVLLSQF